MEEILHFSVLISLQTRILVTHGLTYLPDCDRIIVMHEGQIMESGTYDELMVKDGKLKEIMKSLEYGSSASECIPITFLFLYIFCKKISVFLTNKKNHAISLPR